MVTAPFHDVEIISCGVFKLELEFLYKAGVFSMPVTYLPSQLHMYPHELKKKMAHLIKKKTQAGKRLLLLFGECHSHMYDQTQSSLISRVKGINCPDILLPGETYRSLRRQGVFFLLPDWALHWQDIFQKELGLAGDTAKLFMGDMHTRLVYLDTAVVDPPIQHLRAMSDFTGLPFDIFPVSLQVLQEKIACALGEFDGEVFYER
ncbi:Protein of unknown function [Desulfocicer vacuolatum DSM 3385]|uniref:DUF1638 domain-containing protein n=1 Tax=Desulfocicer vacuolatum DSM 3385 TaxID=1121400 RepID=A0A1W2DX62_9BACT|nr:DUF1638 domain-containing protein [Desulfocicer vacuolatum]SMD02013.1 Protein of unknown function [Desulfocicer vacuolatum DSM 3385]